MIEEHLFYKFHLHVSDLLICCNICNCRVGIYLPTVEVRFNDLSVEAECEVIHGKPIPTLWNTVKGILSVSSHMYLLHRSEYGKLFRFPCYLFTLYRFPCYRSSFVQRKKPR